MRYMRVQHVTRMKVALRRAALRRAALRRAALALTVMAIVARLGLLAEVRADTLVQVLQ